MTIPLKFLKSLSRIALVLAIWIGILANVVSVNAEEQDPWEPFNEKMFWFNREVDRVVLKPAAT